MRFCVQLLKMLPLMFEDLLEGECLVGGDAVENPLEDFRVLRGVIKPNVLVKSIAGRINQVLVVF